MPKFDLTRGVRKEQVTGAAPEEAYTIAQDAVRAFGDQGYAVSFIEEQPPWAFKAHLTGEGGTDLVADVAVTDQGDTTRVDLMLSGHLFLGGLLGRMVNDDVIEREAAKKLDDLVQARFKHTPKTRAPTALKVETDRPDTSTPLAPSVEVHPDSVLHPAKAAPAVEVIDVHAGTIVDARAGSAPTTAEAETRTTRTGASAGSAAAALGGHADLLDAVLDGRRRPRDDERRALADELIASCALAAGAAAVQPTPFVDAGLFHPVQVDLVRALGQVFGERVDRAEAARLLSAMGASVVDQASLLPRSAERSAWVEVVATAFALTFAAGETAVHTFAADAGQADTSPEGLAAAFEAAFERVRSEKLVAARPEAALADRLAQVHEAFEASLLSEEEYVRLKERVLAAF